MKSLTGGCPFCWRIVFGDVDERSDDVAWFEPLNPVTPGHMLFVPTIHHEHPHARSVGEAMRVAVGYAEGAEIESYNLITSNGSPATQTVPHIHVHLVPRHSGDGLRLPWTNQDDPISGSPP